MPTHSVNQPAGHTRSFAGWRRPFLPSSCCGCLKVSHSDPLCKSLKPTALARSLAHSSPPPPTDLTFSFRQSQFRFLPDQTDGRRYKLVRGQRSIKCDSKCHICIHTTKTFVSSIAKETIEHLSLFSPGGKRKECDVGGRVV
jgi:hypothetical protein